MSLRGALIGIALIATSVVAGAHELGTTRVTLDRQPAGDLQIQVVTDAVALLEKLESMGEDPAAAPTEDPALLKTRLLAHEDVFRRRVAVTVDGSAARPDIRWEIEPPAASGAPPLATITLVVDAGRSAGEMTWMYGWTFTPYAFVTTFGPDDSASAVWIEGGDVTPPVSLRSLAPPETRLSLIGRYVALGFVHILPRGADHVLFVLGIFLLARKARPVFLQVTAFTIAHSITLALSIYGVVSLPPAIVEPAIALSIAYVAIENLVVKDLRPWRYGLVFAFGLLHGLGFAGALSDVGLPRTHFLSALLGFNVGVELGQLTVIGLAFLLVGHWFGQRAWYRHRIVMPASACIAAFGIYWSVERLFA